MDHSGPGRVALGFFCTSVSGRRSATNSSTAAPNAVTTHSVPRQPSTIAASPPAEGPISAIRPRPVRPTDITCAPSRGSYRSRSIARAQTTAAAMQAPCTARAAISQPMSGAIDAAAPDSVYSASPASSTGRRPKRSATGPQASCAMPKASSSAAIVICAPLIEAPSSCVSWGSEGR